MGHFKSERGNAMLWILVCIALFAALSYAVMGGSQGGGGDVSREKTALGVSELAQYADTLRSAAQRLLIQEGCSESQLSFEPSPFPGSGDYYNSAAPGDYRCHVFHPAGGGVTAQAIPDEVLTTPGGGSETITGDIVVDSLGTARSELGLLVSPLTIQACQEINAKFAQMDAAAVPPEDAVTSTAKFTGSYTAGADPWGSQSSVANALSGQTNSCREIGSSGTYEALFVLLKR